MLVIIPCGGRKLAYTAPAGELYTGPYHRACRAYAEALGGRVLVLSALYGLLELGTVVEPYDLRMGRPGCVSASRVRDQAQSLNLLSEPEVVALGGRAYTSVCRAVWPCCVTPLVGVGGIGKQLRWLKQQTERLCR